MSAITNKIVVSVITDLVSDQRVHKVCTYLQQKGYAVTLIGRAFKNSAPVEERIYKTERIRCYYQKGFLQYAEFNLKLLLRLLKKPAAVYLSNDLDTLVPNFVLATFRRKKLVYDSHEYFTGTPELQHKNFKRYIWRSIEKFILPKLKYAYTVNQSIADLYFKQYGIKMKVVRNVPLLNKEVDYRNISLPKDRFILLLQGAGINKDRGVAELIESMELLPSHFLLLLIGSGNAWNELKLKAEALKLKDKIWFIEKVSFRELMNYTSQAHVGLSLDKPNCLNYEFSLPNKVFDYIHAGVPLLTSGVIEVKKIVEKYNVGMCIDQITPRSIADGILWIYENPNTYNLWKENTKSAALALCWEKEQQELNKIYDF